MKQADREAMVARHAPPGWADKELRAVIEKSVRGPKYGPPVPMLVLSADIRKSTSLLKESVDLRTFRAIMIDFIKRSRDVVRARWSGWFDKFMGDGFMAYWPIREQEWRVAVECALRVSLDVFAHFEGVVKRRFQEHSRNFSGATTVCFGLDMGDALFACAAEDLTIVGHPVVGACRMVSAAKKPSEIVCNVGLASRIKRSPSGWFDGACQLRVSETIRKTKEDEEQTVYLLDIDDADKTG